MPPRHGSIITVGWVFSFLGIFWVTALVATELAQEWPGLLIPYAVGMLALYAGLARLAYQTLKSRSAPSPAEDGSARRTVENVAEGVGLAIAGVGVMLGLAMLVGALLMAAATIIFLLICFGLLAGMG